MVSFSLILGTVERTRDLEDYLASLDAQTYRNFDDVTWRPSKRQ